MIVKDIEVDVKELSTYFDCLNFSIKVKLS